MGATGLQPDLFQPPPRRRGRPRTRPAAEPKTTSGRTHPVRDKILAFLAEAHSVKEVATHIERRTSTTTGHLRAMYHRGLIIRTGWGVWIRRDKCPNPPDQQTITRSFPVREAILARMQSPMTAADLETATGFPPDKIRHFLRLMLSAGDITQGDDDTFSPASSTQPPEAGAAETNADIAGAA